MKVRTNVKAGGMRLQNHAQSAVVVRTGVKAGAAGWTKNHSQTLLV